MIWTGKVRKWQELKVETGDLRSIIFGLHMFDPFY
jgi:hypothetical protein